MFDFENNGKINDGFFFWYKINDGFEWCCLVIVHLESFFFLKES